MHALFKDILNQHVGTILKPKPVPPPKLVKLGKTLELHFETHIYGKDGTLAVEVSPVFYFNPVEQHYGVCDWESKDAVFFPINNDGRELPEIKVDNYDAEHLLHGLGHDESILKQLDILNKWKHTQLQKRRNNE